VTDEYVDPEVYRLQDLTIHRAVLFAQDIPSADLIWKLGLPATCCPAGVGGWVQVFAHQLVDARVTRVAVIATGPAALAHAFVVGRGVEKVGIDVRVVQLGMELSEYSKEDLLAKIRSTPLLAPLPPEALTRKIEVAPPPPRHFQEHGEQRYSLTLQPEGIVFEVNRLRRSSQELHGELLVRVNGHFAEAKTFGDGILQIGDMNFSSTTTRTSRAKLLAERAGDKSFDWYGNLEDFITSVIAAERRGKPAEVLADVEDEHEDSEAWRIEGFPLLQQLPQIIFGDAASGKSMLAMWLAGMLANQDIPVLYADWEFSQAEHKKRLKQLFQPMPKNLYYIRCEHSLKQEADHLIDIIQKYKIKYIICDSIGFAVDGPAESQEGAAGYFRCLRQLRVGSLNIAHIPKQYDDNREASIFGSIYFKCGARSVWFISRAAENPNGELRFGLYHRKSNVGALLQPKGFKLVFRGDRTLVEAINLKDVEELAAGFPLLDRIKELLIQGPLTMKAISEELNATMPMVKGTLARHRSQFIRMGNKVGVASASDPAPETPDDNSAEF